MLIDVYAAADRLGCGHGYVRKLIKTGDLPALYLHPRALRINTDDLDNYIANLSKDAA